MATAVLSSKGQLVIPLEVRRRLGLNASDQFVCEVVDGKIVLEPEGSRIATLETDRDGLTALSAPEGTPDIVKANSLRFPVSVLPDRQSAPGIRLKVSV